MTSPTNPQDMRPLPRPEAIARLLQAAAVIVILLGVLGVITLWVMARTQAQNAMPPGMTQQETATAALLSVVAMVYASMAALMLCAVSLLVQYGHSVAMSVRLAERRMQTRDVEQARERVVAGEGATFSSQALEVLREINENTLLAESEKARKRTRLAEARRQQMKTEIGQLILATKWPDARSRIEDLRLAFPEDSDAAGLSARLDSAIKEHRDLDIMTLSEEIRSYMSLGLWEKARQTARVLAEKYPSLPEAQKMENVVRLEEEVSRKEDRLRLYREIEHLVARKHYRDAKRTAQTLMERYPESPEAAALKGQMDELLRNADIETRREMEAQIIDYTKQQRHREAYEVARTLLEQFPESPQALALKDQIDKLRERAGMTS